MLKVTSVFSSNKKRWSIESIFLFATYLALFFFILALFITVTVFLKSIFYKTYLEQMETSKELFIQNISKDILIGAEQDVFRKCNEFVRGEIKGVTVTGTSGNEICHFFEAEKNLEKIKGKVFFDSTQSKIASEIKVFFSMSKIDSIFYKIIFYIMFIFLSTTLGLFLLFRMIGKRISLPLKKITNVILHSELDQIINHSSDTKILEIHLLSERIKEFAKTILEHKKMELFQKEAEAKIEIASQVAHDIRSPLAALDMALKDEATLPENKRIIVRTATNRIHEIANELLLKNKKKESDKNSEVQNILLSGLVESIVAEKRMQYRSRPSILIQAILDENSYGLFTLAIPRELKRIISNLINNSVEAFLDSTGLITVFLRKNNSFAEIVIKDNGKGIPEKILKEIGERRISFGKENSSESGNGLSLFHAKKYIEEISGRFQIKTEMGKGTEIILSLPLSEMPKTFTPFLNFYGHKKIVIIDDDQSIHQIWNGRLESALANTNGEQFEIIHFSTLADANEWTNEEKKLGRLLTENFFLVDYEFIGEKENGIDFIIREKIIENAVLVTSRFEENTILSRSLDHNIRLIPKGLAPYVPIKSISQRTSEVQTTILIDDDELVRLVWETRAKENKIAFEAYADPSGIDFSSLSKKTIFYIDSNLKNNQKGEELALNLYKKGFEEIYLATGHEKESFVEMKFLKGIIGKKAPW